MKKHLFLVPGILALVLTGFPQQEIKLSGIQKPGGSGFSDIRGIVLAENLLGPRKLVFSGNAPGSALPVISKEELGPSGGKGSFDKLAVQFSGKIYSPNMAEPVIFENKTPEELVRLEFPILPIALDQPYMLFIDLSINVISKPIGMTLSDDAGTYRAVLNVILIDF